MFLLTLYTHTENWQNRFLNGAQKEINEEVKGKQKYIQGQEKVCQHSKPHSEEGLIWWLLSQLRGQYNDKLLAQTDWYLIIHLKTNIHSDNHTLLSNTSTTCFTFYILCGDRALWYIKGWKSSYEQWANYSSLTRQIWTSNSEGKFNKSPWSTQILFVPVIGLFAQISLGEYIHSNTFMLIQQITATISIQTNSTQISGDNLSQR